MGKGDPKKMKFKSLELMDFWEGPISVAAGKEHKGTYSRLPNKRGAEGKLAGGLKIKKKWEGQITSGGSKYSRELQEFMKNSIFEISNLKKLMNGGMQLRG